MTVAAMALLLPMSEVTVRAILSAYPVMVISTPKIAPTRKIGNQLPTNPAIAGMKISV